MKTTKEDLLSALKALPMFLLKKLITAAQFCIFFAASTAVVWVVYHLIQWLINLLSRAGIQFADKISLGEYMCCGFVLGIIILLCWSTKHDKRIAPAEEGMSDDAGTAAS